jgi:glutathione S-transferase
MALELYFHPLSSYCQKSIIALYENDTAFEPRLVDLSNPTERAALVKLWPLGKFPVLRDQARDQTVPEATIIIEYLAQHYPGKSQLVPSDPDLARETRLHDRTFDLYVNDSVGKIVTDKFRPEGQHDVIGVEHAKARILEVYAMLEKQMAARTWAIGDAFTMADCAAAPSLFFASRLVPLGESHRNVASYLGRLMERPSVARAAREAEPYLKLMPK